MYQQCSTKFFFIYTEIKIGLKKKKSPGPTSTFFLRKLVENVRHQNVGVKYERGEKNTQGHGEKNHRIIAIHQTYRKTIQS